MSQEEFIRYIGDCNENLTIPTPSGAFIWATEAATAKAEAKLSAKDEVIAQCEKALKAADMNDFATVGKALAAIAKHKEGK
jgi:hypothetical protein